MSTAVETSTKRLRRRDYLLAAMIGLLVAGFHLANGYALSDSVLLQSFNWVFDLDSSRFIGAWCLAGADVWGDIGGSFLGRHALTVAIRPACLGLAALTGDPFLALMALAALCAGCVAATAYFLAAQFCPEVIDRILLAIGFAVSAQPLLLGVLPETYGFALAGIGIHLTLVAYGRAAPPAADRSAVLSLVLNAGITITNAGLNIVSSAARAWNRLTMSRWLAIEIRTWLYAGIALAVIVVPLAMLSMPEFLADAGAVPKQVWWTININRGSEPASLVRVVITFLLYGFVAPALTNVYLPEPDGHPMLDFREFSYGAAGGLALAAWCVAMMTSIYFALREPGLRRLLVIVACWMVINIVLHWYWQYRGSVYLYGAHTAYPLFALLVVGYASALQRCSRGLVRGGAAAMLVLAAINNLEVYSQMIAFLLEQSRGG